MPLHSPIRGVLLRGSNPSGRSLLTEPLYVQAIQPRQDDSQKTLPLDPPSSRQSSATSRSMNCVRRNDSTRNCGKNSPRLPRSNLSSPGRSSITIVAFEVDASGVQEGGPRRTAGTVSVPRRADMEPGPATTNAEFRGERMRKAFMRPRRKVSISRSLNLHLDGSELTIGRND